MKSPRKKLLRFILSCVLVSTATCAYADATEGSYTQANHYEIIGALGPTNLSAGNSQLGVTRSETDKLVQTNSNDWEILNGQLGVGYYYYFSPTSQTNIQWLPAIEPQLNIYFFNNNNAIEGDVWRFNSSAYNHLAYNMGVRSIRLMLDAALTVVKKDRSSLYFKGGIGNAWNRISYQDSANGSNPDCINQALTLNTQSHRSLAWELGLGVIYDFNNIVGISLEYLYADLGNAHTASQGNSPAITNLNISPASLPLQTQTVSLGLHFAL